MTIRTLPISLPSRSKVLNSIFSPVNSKSCVLTVTGSSLVIKMRLQIEDGGRHGNVEILLCRPTG